MKRSEMLTKMQRVYAIRHVMVEGKYITLEQFMDELLSYLEQNGMLPPPSAQKSVMPEVPDFIVNAWEPEDEI